MRAAIAILFVALLAWLCGAPLGAGGPEQPFDLVILHGRVMDPESNLDAVRNVAISGGKVRELTAREIRGKETIEARGLVVAPGFIDLHQHGHEARNYQFKARDGVTTSLELEAGTADVDTWYAEREGRTLIHYGVSAGHIPVRMKVLADGGKVLPTDSAAHREATPAQLKEIEALLERGLARGALAVGMGINYTPGATHQEILEVFQVAAAARAPVHVHLRYGGLKEPATGLEGLEEVVADAAATGAPLHVVHITSMGLGNTPVLLAVIRGARARGLDVTTECYPYTA